MRDVFISELVREVLGPRDGAEEVLSEDPYDEYLTGVIVPKNYINNELEEIDTELGLDSGNAEDDSSDIEFLSNISPALDPRSKPKSIGLSFRLEGDDPSLKLCLTWGRYILENGNWKRKPDYKIIEVKMDEIPEDRYVFKNIYRKNDGEIDLALIKKLVQNNTISVTINLINNLIPVMVKFRPDTSCCIFQPSMRIKLIGDTRLVSEQHETLLDSEESTLYFLYRNKPSLVKGHMCASCWNNVDPEIQDKKLSSNFRSFWADGIFYKDCNEFFAPDFRSEFVPICAMPSPDFSLNTEMESVPTFFPRDLSEVWLEQEIDKYLLPVYHAYSAWINKNESILESLKGSGLEVAKRIIAAQKNACGRILSGIDLLKTNENIRLSFCFANRVIWLQNSWKGNNDFQWYPFQLAFFLMNLEPLFSENSRYRGIADLLWIPTGGGKTEAYLSIMAYIIALRRRIALTDVSTSRNKTGGGTSVISRYTLRLLTVQQFRRTVQMVTAAEYLRLERVNGSIGWRPEKCQIPGDFIFGSVRFSAGLWVGGGVTPNMLAGEHGAIKALKGKNKESEPAQLTTCPACGTWLSVPSGGMPEGEQYRIHLVIKAKEDEKDIENFTKNFVMVDEHLEIRGVGVTSENHADGFFTATFLIQSSNRIKEEDIDRFWSEISQEAKRFDLNLAIASFSPSRQGYFPIMEPTSKSKSREGDFEIYCPNPECYLNKGTKWVEGIPLNTRSEDTDLLPDGLYVRRVETPFNDGKRIPIPAYTVDEQIYGRCPTIVVATADKIARLAFEPRIASIFGNVTEYNSCYGFLREGYLPGSATKICKESENVLVSPFSPPNLIVQDELHLIDGPLGSMFGLYEIIVNDLCSNYGTMPKVIASTATIKHANTQIRSLFDREIFQFPPYGLDFDDSFFIHYPSTEDAWNETRPGRIYIGVCAPGRGSHTPLVRIWSRLLKTGNDMRGFENIEYFWTIVGYFNAIRELGGALALYRQDIVERLEKISIGADLRGIDHSDPSKVIELSSRIDSTRLPSILKELEQSKKSVGNNPDAIFATSMFGTGVDIPHLSLMAVHGQPKTTSAYIQATGRVGRKYGALVLTFLRASRPRDMSHYEMFVNYHNNIYKEVEPVSVSPFSEGALNKGLGPAIVSLLRNMRDPHVTWWDGGHGNVILDPDSENDIDKVINIFQNRIANLPESVKQGKSQQSIKDSINIKLDKWKYLASQSDISLVFNEYILFADPKKDVILGDPAHKHAGRKVVYTNAPQSLRDVEETTGFEV